MHASGYARAEDSWYQEPAWIVDAMLDVEPLIGSCLDPACGEGVIPKALIARGIPCEGSDIADRGYGNTGVNFLTSQHGANNVVSNPPFELMREFIDHALVLTTHKIIMLGRLAFLEGQSRRKWFATVPLARVWASSRRVSMPPGGKGIVAKGGTIAVAWFVFEHGHQGPWQGGWV